MTASAHQDQPTATPTPLMEIVAGVWASKTLAVAHELGLFTLFAQKGEQSAAEVAAACGIEERPSRMLLTACASLGLLAYRDGRFANTDMSQQYLVPGRPYYFGGAVKLFDGRYDGWMRLAEAVRNNGPTNWDPEDQDSLFHAGDADLKSTFWEGMYSLSAYSARMLAKTVDLSGVRSLLDVGGGGAAYDIELCRAYPDIRATVFDLPFVCELTARRIEGSEFADRIGLHPGDFLNDETLPAGHDAIVLSMILHDWAEPENQRILAKCFDALPSGGLIIISELLVEDDHSGPRLAALMGLNMLVETWGRNYTIGEYRTWLENTGFHDIRTVRFDAPGANGVVIGTKP